jgi:hypothetical protein
MTEKTKLLPENGHSVHFSEPTGNVTIGSAKVRHIPIYSPRHFDNYREEARLVMKVLKGECSKEEALTLPEFSYNACGLNTFLAALAYEILEGEQ